MKRIFLICLCAVSALAVWAQNERPIVTIETSMGEMVVELFNETPYFIILNLAWGGTWGGEKGVDNRALPATMAIDYVRVWQPKQ